MRCPRTGLRNNGLYGPPSPTLDIFIICSPSGLCASFSCCMVSCGKRGGFVAGDKLAPIAPNTSPPITATVKEHRSVRLIVIPPYLEVSRLRTASRPGIFSVWPMNSSLSNKRRPAATDYLSGGSGGESVRRKPMPTVVPALTTPGTSKPSFHGSLRSPGHIPLQLALCL